MADDLAIAAMNPIIKRSVVLDGHKTSISLEEEFWSGLKKIAQARGVSPSAVIANIDAGRHQGGLSSAIRVFVLEHYQGSGR